MAKQNKGGALRRTLSQTKRFRITTIYTKKSTHRYGLYLGGAPSPATTAGSVVELLTGLTSTPFRKKILRELKKVRVRLVKLLEEGYMFDGEIGDLVRDILNSETNIVMSNAFLKKLKKMDMKYLRTHAAYYKGETDINKIIALYNKEVAAKRAATRARKAAEQAAQKGGVEPVPEEVPDESEVLRSGIVADEERYIARVLQFIGATDEDRINYAIERAQSVLNMIYGADLEEIKAIMDFIDKNGKLSDVINAAEREFDGLFYDAPRYNMDILGVTPFGGENLFEHIFGDDADYMPSSFYDFRNEIEDEDDFSDVPF